MRSSSATLMPLPRRSLPAMARVRQQLPTEHIERVSEDVRDKLIAWGIGSRVRRGDRVAITAGSRGIGGFIELLSGIVEAVKACGAQPFIVPAMGSHGGATADGQTEILRRLGVTEESTGAPIHATMETNNLGASQSGAAAHVDRLAFEANGIIVLARTKTHPESTGPLASGLLKMCTIGLGKQAGAHQAHSHGLWDSIRAVPKLQLAQAPYRVWRGRRRERLSTAVRHRNRASNLRRVPRGRSASSTRGETSSRPDSVRRPRSADRR